jgi:hypothetical protein
MLVSRVGVSPSPLRARRDRDARWLDDVDDVRPPGDEPPPDDVDVWMNASGTFAGAIRLGKLSTTHGVYRCRRRVGVFRAYDGVDFGTTVGPVRLMQNIYLASCRKLRKVRLWTRIHY